MALDVAGNIYARVWALLEARPEFAAAVKPANRIKSTVFEWAETDSTKTNSAGPADFPKVRIDLAEETDMDRAPRVFCTSPASVDLPVPMTINVDISVLFYSTVLTDQTPLEAAIRGAILGAGETLGLIGPNNRPYVSGVVIRGVTRKTEKSAATGGSLRTLSRRRLVVSARPMRSLLIAIP